MTNPEPARLDPRILGDLRPVRPLARPWKRSLAVTMLGVVVALALTTGLGVRKDASELGAAVLWGLSVSQAAYGFVLLVAALRSAVPGRALGARAATGLLAGGVAIVLAITYATWLTHPSHVPPAAARAYFRICLSTPVLAGLPPLALTLLLVFRAYPTRPALTGGLAGLGAGLLADGSWRTYCEVSDPGHVLSTHFASVALLAAGGMVLAVLLSRLAHPSESWRGEASRRSWPA